jgi:hypothetical protein
LHRKINGATGQKQCQGHPTRRIFRLKSRL